MSHPQPLYNEKELLQAIAAGDEHAFRAIFDHYRPKIYQYARHLTESDDMADEVIQEVFMKLWLNRAKLDAIEKFNSWLHAVARNYIFDAFKKTARQRTGTTKLIQVTPTSIDDADTWLLDKENEAWLNDALNQLTPSQKQVYLLSRQQGMNTEQIAQELNIAINTAKKHLADSLQGLRTYLKKHNTIMAIIAGETVLTTCFI